MLVHLTHKQLLVEQNRALLLLRLDLRVGAGGASGGMAWFCAFWGPLSHAWSGSHAVLLVLTVTESDCLQGALLRALSPIQMARVVLASSPYFPGALHTRYCNGYGCAAGPAALLSRCSWTQEPSPSACAIMMLRCSQTRNA